MNRVILAIPTDQGLRANASTYMALMARRPDVAPLTQVGRPADYARNQACRRLLADPQYTHIWFMDSDIGPPLDALDRLLALDAPIATGCCAVMLTTGLRWALANRDARARYRLLRRLDSRVGPFEVDACGAGCLLVRRHVIERMGWPWFRWRERRDGSQLSEDIFFCRRANRLGLRVAVDPAVRCEHPKPIDLTALLWAAQPADPEQPTND